MKTLFYFITLFFILKVTAQQEPIDLENKNFIAKMGSVCEETPEPNPCAGQQIYMLLQFQKNSVDVIEERVDTCGETTSEFIDNFPYTWAKNKHWFIVLGDKERTQHTIVENVAILLIDSTLIGTRFNEDGFVVEEFRFLESVKN